jgi:hypothetical protein
VAGAAPEIAGAVMENLEYIEPVGGAPFYRYHLGRE